MSASSTLSQYLADPTLAGVNYVLVSLDLLANNARLGHPAKTISILAPRPMFDITCTSTLYSTSIHDGHSLNPTGTQNRLDAAQTHRAVPPTWITITFTMSLDGTLLQSEDGRGYVVAVTGTGEAVTGHGTRTAGGLELTFGDPPADRSAFNPDHHWIGSAVRNMDVTLQAFPTLRGRLGGSRSSFRR